VTAEGGRGETAQKLPKTEAPRPKQEKVDLTITNDDGKKKGCC
jgi:hypothetical protein